MGHFCLHFLLEQVFLHSVGAYQSPSLGLQLQQIIELLLVFNRVVVCQLASGLPQSIGHHSVLLTLGILLNDIRSFLVLIFPDFHQHQQHQRIVVVIARLQRSSHFFFASSLAPPDQSQRSNAALDVLEEARTVFRPEAKGSEVEVSRVVERIERKSSE